jgi:putative transposase
MSASYKNRAAVEYESRTAELPYDRLLEHDEDVLAYAHQPDFPVKGRYTNAVGRIVSVTSTLDRLVIRQKRAVLVEVKTEEALAQLANERPGFVIRDSTGRRWRNPSFEAYLAPFGIEFEYVTEASYAQTRIRNIESLGAAFRAPLPAPSIVMAVHKAVRCRPGLALGTLISASVSLGDIFVLVAAGVVYVDLDRDDLTAPDDVPVFLNRTVAAALASAHAPSFAIGSGSPAPLSLRTGSRFAWQGANVEVVISGPDKVLIRDASDAGGEGTWVTRKTLDSDWREGGLVPADPPPASAGTPHPGAQVARQRYELTGDDGVAEALRRWDLLAAWKASPGKAIPTDGSRRSLHRWESNRRAMEALTGDPLVGLCPLPPSGNRKDKIHLRVVEITAAVIIERYLIPNGDIPAAVIAEVQRRCQKAGLPKPHDRTVQRRIDEIPEEVVVEARQGRKAAYNLRQWALIRPDAAHPNGDFPFAVAHIDGTELDLECVHSRTRLVLGRPWLHRMVDGQTGLELARYLGFVNTSEAVVLELIWRCALKWRALPLRLTVDIGSEHRGKALKVLALAYGIELNFRPNSRARHGAPVERSFLALDLDLLYQLAGNTQSRKNVRQETPEINPSNHAVHSIKALDQILDRYNAIIADRVSTELAEKRGDALRRGLEQRAGTVVPFVAVDDRLRFLTLAPVTGTTRWVHPVKGFMVGRHMFHDARFKTAPLKKTHRKVRQALGDPTFVMLDTGSGYLRVANRSIARERVTSLQDIPFVSAERARTAAVADSANGVVRIELAGLRTEAEELTAAEAKAAAESEPVPGRAENEERGAYIERLRAEETLETQSAHLNSGAPPAMPLDEPHLPNIDEYEPYADAWEGVA